MNAGVNIILLRENNVKLTFITVQYKEIQAKKNGSFKRTVR